MLDKLRRTVLVLGNGFDLDLGLHTSYKDFWQSKYCPKDYPAPLIFHLNKHWSGSLDAVRWYDLENELYYYCKGMNPTTPKIDVITKPERILIEKADPYSIACGILQQYPDQANSLLNKGLIVEDLQYVHRYRIPYREELLLSPDERDHEAFCLIKKGLCQYIDTIERFENEIDTCAHLVLGSVLNAANNAEGDLVSVYSFNYTPLLRNGQKVTGVPVYHIHGNCEKGRIIIGTRDDLTMDKDYDFVIKSYDSAYAPPGLVNDLQSADVVIIFGHSIGVNDRQYFESFFSQQANTNNKSPKKIIIFTRNNLSELEVKRALQVMTGGNLASLYSITQPKIIKTELLEKGDPETQSIFRSFLISYGLNEHVAEMQIGKLNKSNS